MIEVQGRYVEVDGEIAFVESRGEGPAVLCIHTAGQSGRQWRDVLTELPALGWSVHVPDLPGHGRSDLPAAGPIESIEHYARWCGDLVRGLGLSEVLAVGCSIGGKIALQLAIDGPEEVAGVVSLAADGWNTTLSESTLRRSLPDPSSPSRGDRTYLGTLDACGASVPKDRAEGIARRHRCEDPIVSILDLVAWTNHDVREQASSICIPVQLAYGTDDFWVRGEDIDALAASIPVCRCEELVDIGHYPMEEIPGFATRLHEWLGWLRDDAGGRAGR